MTKRVVLAFGLEKVKIDPQFCDHQNVIHQIEVDGTITICSDCGAWLDEQGEIVRMPNDNIPIFEEEL
jgi:hypothetical protein